LGFFIVNNSGGLFFALGVLPDPTLRDKKPGSQSLTEWAFSLFFPEDLQNIWVGISSQRESQQMLMQAEQLAKWVYTSLMHRA
jgi:hypothetical protein